MKKFVIIGLPLLLLFACSKKSGDPGAPNTIRINGTTYTTVVIGNQTWTSENYHGPGGGEQKATGGDAEINGDYYNAANIALPAGWRVPTRDDYNHLLVNYTGTTDPQGNIFVNQDYTDKFKSTTGWKISDGNNGLGFNAYPSGYLNAGATQGSFVTVGKGDIANFLTSTQDPGDASEIYIFNIGDYTGNSYNGFGYFSDVTTVNSSQANPYYASLRFVKDN